MKGKITMKKMIVSLLTTAMVMVSCTSVFAEEVELAGTWYLNSIEEEGMEFSPAMMGMEMELVLNDDGSAELTSIYGGEADTDAAQWAETDGGVTVTDSEGTEMPLVLDEDGNLVMDEDGTIMVFGKEKIEGETFDPGVAVEDTELEDFIGSWEAAYLGMADGCFPYAMMGMTGSLEITADGATLTESMGEDMEFTTEYTLSFENGILTLKDEYDDTKLFQMYDSGALADITYAVDAAEEEASYTYYQKPEADATAGETAGASTVCTPEAYDAAVAVLNVATPFETIPTYADVVELFGGVEGTVNSDLEYEGYSYYNWTDGSRTALITFQVADGTETYMAITGDI